jgi:hypothetical protein
MVVRQLREERRRLWCCDDEGIVVDLTGRERTGCEQ